jgi:hypothetical protein
MREESRKGTIFLRDERNPRDPQTRLIDVIQLNDTYKNQPRDNAGVFIHTAPDERIHADIYLGPHVKEEKGVQITYSIIVSGAVNSGTSVPIASGQTFGFAGSIIGISGAIGTFQAVLSDTELTLSSEDEVYGTIFVGSTLTLRGSPPM